MICGDIKRLASTEGWFALGAGMNDLSRLLAVLYIQFRCLGKNQLSFSVTILIHYCLV